MTKEKLEERRDLLKQQLTNIVNQHTIVSGQLAEIEYLLSEENKPVEKPKKGE